MVYPAGPYAPTPGGTAHTHTPDTGPAAARGGTHGGMGANGLDQRPTENGPSQMDKIGTTGLHRLQQASDDKALQKQQEEGGPQMAVAEFGPGSSWDDSTAEEGNAEPFLNPVGV